MAENLVALSRQKRNLLPSRDNYCLLYILFGVTHKIDRFWHVDVCVSRCEQMSNGTTAGRLYARPNPKMYRVCSRKPCIYLHKGKALDGQISV